MAGSSIWAPVGDKGPTGDPGPIGPPGIQGPAGGPGPDAATFVAYVASLANTVDPLQGVTLVGGAIRVVANVAALKALPAAGAKSVFVLGGLTRFDGGGGLYVENIGDTTTPANNGSIIAATDNQRWFLQNPYSVTPAHFSAKGDWNGTTGTDDSAAFVNISLHLVTYGGTLTVNKRHYVKNGWVCNATNYAIEGTGSAEIHSDGASAQHTFSATSVSNVSINGVKFSQPRSLFRGNEFAICFTESSDLTVVNCKTDGATAGIWFTHCTRVKALNNIVDTPKADGIHFAFGSSHCKAMGNTVLNAGDDSYACTYYDSTTGRPNNIQFLNNKAVGGMWGFGCAMYGADNVTVMNNDFSECALGAFQTTTFAGSTPCTNIRIKNNTVQGSNRVNAVPNNYWYGTADAPLTSPLHLSCAVIAGTNIRVVSNDIDDVNCLIGGAATRTAVMFNGGALMYCNANNITRVSGVGINGGTSNVSQVNVNFNTMDSVNDVFILFNSTPLSNGLSICNNETGIGANIGASNMILVAGAGSVRVVITNNTNQSGRSVSVSTSTNVLNINNNF